jgi:hypothetical protein
MKLFKSLEEMIIDGKKYIDIFSPEIFDYSIETEKYLIEGFETPEQVAKKLYGNEYYYWVILKLNKVVNPIEDWIKSEEELIEELEGLDVKFIIDWIEKAEEQFEGLNFTEEELKNLWIKHKIAENENKREIKVLSKENMRRFR